MEMECVLTFEEVVLQAAVLHVLVDEQAVLVLAAVAHQLHQVGMPQLPQEDHLRLRPDKKKNTASDSACHAQCTSSPDRPGPPPYVLGRARRATQLIRRSPEPSRSLNHHRPLLPAARA